MTETTMKYGKIPGIDKPISRLVQGTVMVRSEDIDYGFALMDDVYERGCRCFDTGHVYGSGDNERSFGKWVHSRGVREEIVVLGKGAHHNQDRRRVTPFDITADIHDSLARFDFDYIDLYVLHRDDPSVPVGPIVETLNEHKEAGLIRAFGGSNWSHDRIAAANVYAKEHGLTPFVVSSPNFSLAEQVNEPWPECVSIGAEPGDDAREWYADHDVALFPWSSLAGGFFTGRITRDNKDEVEGYLKLAVHCYGYEQNFKRLDRVRELAEEKGLTIPQVALGYVLHYPGLNVFALSGPRTREEFEDNLQALNVELTPDEIAWLELKTDSR